MCYYNSISINKVNKFYEDVKKSLNKKKAADLSGSLCVNGIFNYSSGISCVRFLSRMPTISSSISVVTDFGLSRG